MDHRTPLEIVGDYIRKRKIHNVLLMGAVMALVFAIAYSLITTITYSQVVTLHFVTPDEIGIRRTTNFTKTTEMSRDNICDSLVCVNRSTIVMAQQRLLIDHSRFLPFVCTSMLDIEIERELPWVCTIIRRSDNETLSGSVFHFTARLNTKLDYEMFIPYFERSFTGTTPKKMRVYSEMSTKNLDLWDDDSVYFSLMGEIIRRGEV